MTLPISSSWQTFRIWDIVTVYSLQFMYKMLRTDIKQRCQYMYNVHLTRVILWCSGYTTGRPLPSLGLDVGQSTRLCFKLIN